MEMFANYGLCLRKSLFTGRDITRPDEGNNPLASKVITPEAGGC